MKHILINAPTDTLEYFFFFFLVRVVKCLEKVHNSPGKHFFQLEGSKCLWLSAWQDIRGQNSRVVLTAGWYYPKRMRYFRFPSLYQIDLLILKFLIFLITLNKTTIQPHLAWQLRSIQSPFCSMNDSNLYSEEITGLPGKMQLCLCSSSVLTPHWLWLSNNHIFLLSILKTPVPVSKWSLYGSLSFFMYKRIFWELFLRSTSDGICPYFLHCFAQSVFPHDSIVGNDTILDGNSTFRK